MSTPQDCRETFSFQYTQEVSKVLCLSCPHGLSRQSLGSSLEVTCPQNSPKHRKRQVFVTSVFSYLVLPGVDVSNTLAGTTVKELAYWNR